MALFIYKGIRDGESTTLCVFQLILPTAHSILLKLCKHFLHLLHLFFGHGKERFHFLRTVFVPYATKSISYASFFMVWAHWTHLNHHNWTKDDPCIFSCFDLLSSKVDFKLGVILVLFESFFVNRYHNLLIEFELIALTTNAKRWLYKN